MEKGKLPRSVKEASKRSRQVSAEGSGEGGRGGGGRGHPSPTLGGAGQRCQRRPRPAPSPQAPVLYAMLDHGRGPKAASEKKAKGAPGESRKDKK